MSTPNSKPGGWGFALILAVLGALLYLPSFSVHELDDEEGRRALPAREMIESGDYVVPTLWGQPYLNKPPFFFWMVAGASSLMGGVTEASTRLPSVLSTILTSILLAWVGRRMFDARTGLCAGALFLVTFAVFEKGAFGELDAAFTLGVFASTVALYLAGLGSRMAGWLTALTLAAALLTKGPPALLFFGTAVIGIAVAHRNARYLRSFKLWLPLAGALLLSSVWAYLLFERLNSDDAISTWSGQMARGKGDGLAKYFAERKVFIGSVLTGFFPPSLVLLVALRGKFKELLSEKPAMFAAVTAGLGLLIFGLLPGSRARYVHPMLPWVALLAARVLTTQLESCDPKLGKRLVWLGRLIAFCGVAGFGITIAVSFKPIAGATELGTFGWILAPTLLVVAIYSWRSWTPQTQTRALWSAFAVLGLIRLIQLTVLIPQTGLRNGRIARAAQISEQIPENEPLQVTFTGHYNLLFYVDRPIEPLADPREAPPGAHLLLHEYAISELESEPAVAFERLLTTDEDDGRRFALIRIDG